MSDYLKLRGKCQQLSKQAADNNPDLTLVRGWYLCPIWGKQDHWWCKDKSGKIHDPTAKQFPSNGCGEYVEFDGKIECAHCQAITSENDASFYGNYAFCSGNCLSKFVY